MANYVFDACMKTASLDELTVDFVKSHLPDVVVAAIDSRENVQQESIEKFWRRVLTTIIDEGSQGFSESFQVFRSYISHLNEQNEGSIIRYETTRDLNGNPRFGRLVVMFPCQISFLKAAKPIISLDGGHMKHLLWASYQVLVCAGQDGANRDLLFAFALVPSESEVSYSFLLNTMMQNEDMKEFLKQDGLIVTSDRSKGLLNTVKNILPRSFHRYCALHLLGNIKGAFNEDQRAKY